MLKIDIQVGIVAIDEKKECKRQDDDCSDDKEWNEPPKALHSKEFEFVRKQTHDSVKSRMKGVVSYLIDGSQKG